MTARIIASASTLVFLITQAGPTALETTAARTSTVQPEGPRAGKPGSAYLNVEGTKNGKYASFGVLDFPPIKVPGKPGAIGGARLTLTQSVARFSKPGKVKLYLVDQGGDVAAMKFAAGRPGGLGDQAKPMLSLGTASFAVGKTGQVDTFPLTLAESARDAIARRLEAGTEIRLLIVPDDEEVAATYFGAGADEADRCPRLTIEVGAR